MKTHFFKKTSVGILLGLFSTALLIHAQGFGGGRGGGGFGGGGFGGFGGGGFGGGGNRGTSTSTSGQYNNNGQVGSATFAVDPDTHTITVIADEDTARQIQEVIDNLDRPKRQVLIKVVFLQVTHNNSLDLGVQGGWAGPAGNSSVSAANAFGLSQLNSASTTYNALGTANTTQSPGASGNNGGFYQVIGKDYQATLQALAQQGKAEVLARPSVLARDGQLAEIVAGQYIYLPSGVSFGSVGTSSSTTIPTINGNYQNVGIQLDVTPFIGANNMVEMILVPQNTSVDTSSPGQVITSASIFSSAIYAPNINKTTANTVVVTPDGQTVVIGGLIQDVRSSNVSQVPVLGDIPVLGNLFKSTTKSKQKEELVIFITPHIVQGADQLSVVTEREQNQASQFVTNSFNEQELDHFLDKIPVKKSH